MRQVLSPVNDNGGIAALARKTRATATGHHSSAKISAGSHSTDRIIDGLRNNDSKRRLTIVRTIYGVERPACGVKTNLACDLTVQFGLQAKYTKAGRCCVTSRCANQRSIQFPRLHFFTFKTSVLRKAVAQSHRGAKFGR